MRAGAGYVTALRARAPRSPSSSIKLLEAMTRALPDARRRATSPHGADAVLEATGRGGALVLGPGLGRERGGAGVRARRLRAARGGARSSSTPTASTPTRPGSARSRRAARRRS